MKLTEPRIRAVKPTDKDHWLNDGRGLYLRVRRGGSKVWVIRHKRAGKTTVVTLENYPALSLKAARFGRLHSLLASFGMTPSDRSKVIVVDKGKTDDPWSKL